MLAAWNGFMLRAFAEAGRILGREDYLQTATHNADFILEHMLADGRLRRSWRGGGPSSTPILKITARSPMHCSPPMRPPARRKYVVKARKLGRRDARALLGRGGKLLLRYRRRP